MKWHPSRVSWDSIWGGKWLCFIVSGWLAVTAPQLVFFCHKQLRALCVLFVRCSDERSHRSDLFSKDVVTVGAVHPRGDLTAMLLPPSWTRGLVRAMKARCWSSYHTKSHCARRAISWSTYTSAAAALYSRIFSHMCDEWNAFTAVIFVSHVHHTQPHEDDQVLSKTIFVTNVQ